PAPRTGAEGDEPDGPETRLHRIYSGRTFRFCFTNQQMAAAVTDFLWTQEDLRPDGDPFHVVAWRDDSYSEDLLDGFFLALGQMAARESAADWAATASLAGPAPAGVGPALGALARGTPVGTDFRLTRPTIPQRVPSSVGSFQTPNKYEYEAAKN